MARTPDSSRKKLLNHLRLETYLRFLYIEWQQAPDYDKGTSLSDLGRWLDRHGPGNTDFEMSVPDWADKPEQAKQDTTLDIIESVVTGSKSVYQEGPFGSSLFSALEAPDPGSREFFNLYVEQSRVDSMIVYEKEYNKKPLPDGTWGLSDIMKSRFRGMEFSSPRTAFFNLTILVAGFRHALDTLHRIEFYFQYVKEALDSDIVRSVIDTRVLLKILTPDFKDANTWHEDLSKNPKRYSEEREALIRQHFQRLDRDTKTLENSPAK